MQSCPTGVHSGIHVPVLKSHSFSKLYSAEKMYNTSVFLAALTSLNRKRVLTKKRQLAEYARIKLLNFTTQVSFFVIVKVVDTFK